MSSRHNWHQDECYCIELFCGSAGLTAVCRQVFPSSFGVDHKVSSAPKSKIVQLNLDDYNNQQLVLSWIRDPRCIYVHWGIPCGASSRARDIKMSKRSHGPPPLRNKQFPNGVPAHWLSTKKLARLRAANRLYDFMVLAILDMPESSVWTIENPWRSWLWETLYLKKLLARRKVHFFQFDMCMFGGKRLKRTAIATNSEIIGKYALTCDNKHEHLPYEFRNGSFDTASEAEYPSKFCKILFTAVCDHLSRVHNWPSLKPSKLKLVQNAAIAVGNQPTKRIPSLVPEFSKVIQVTNVPCDCVLPLSSKRYLTQCVQFSSSATSKTVVHVSAKMLRRTTKGGDDNTPQLFQPQDSLVQPTSSDLVVSCLSAAGKCDGSCNPLKSVACTNNRISDELAFGVPWEPVEFLQQVAKVGHPQHIFDGLSDEIKFAVDMNAKLPYHELVVLRGKWFAKYVNLSRDLKKENDDILSSMSPSRRRIMSCKRLALLRRILRDESYSDISLVDDIVTGFSLVGEAPESGGRLPSKFVPAALSVDGLKLGAEKARQAVKFTTRSCGSHEQDVALWDKTLQEVEKGWLEGPIQWDSLSGSAVVSRRFPLQQGQKLRPIDDYSMSQVNAALTTRDQATADNVDVVCAMLLSYIRSFQNAGRTADVVARSFDLSAAYRQLCISDESAEFSYVAVYNPYVKCAEVFKQVALPFGARASVNAFIRCSRCIQWLAARCLMLPTTCYYDDFVVCCHSSLASNSEQCMSMLLDLLGWSFDKTGSKADSFSHSVSTLGVVISLQRARDGLLSVSNTDKRTNEVCELIDDIRATAKLAFRDAQVARGRLSFAYAQIFGSSGRLALQQISQHAYRKPFVLKVDEKLLDSLVFLQNRLASKEPRVIDCNLEKFFIVLTDASLHHDRSGGLGGVLVDSAGMLVQWYQLPLAASQVQSFMSVDQEVAIAELESVALFVAILLWSVQLRSSHAILCLDNEVTRYGCMKGYSNALNVGRLCHLLLHDCEKLCLIPWFLRVPSSANIADFPSRQTAHPFLTNEKCIDDGITKARLDEVMCRFHDSPPLKGGAPRAECSGGMPPTPNYGTKRNISMCVILL